jgi:group I intron endonuclease
MERNYKLYVHIVPNGKRYYGITMQKPERRWANGKGYQNNEYFTRAINKYGWSNIQHIVLQESLDEEEAKELEQYMIQWYNTASPNYGYNISLGGESNNFSETTKRKMSKAQKGKTLSEEHKQKLSKAHTGKTLSEETRKKLSESQMGERNNNYGKHRSEETRKKISEAQKGRKLPEERVKKMRENSPTARTVICITTNRVFRSSKEAARYYNISSHSNIIQCCRGNKSHSCCGKLPTGEKLVWRYIDIIEL